MSEPAQLSYPPAPTIKDRVGPKSPGFDAEAIARAEAALKSLASNFHEWMVVDVDKLEAARLAARATDFAEAETEELFCRAHDVKGLGTTYEYPLATALAGSLCKMIETPEARAISRPQSALIEAHVDAIRAVVRDRMKGPDHAVGKMVAAELGARVLELMGDD